MAASLLELKSDLRFQYKEPESFLFLKHSLKFPKGGIVEISSPLGRGKTRFVLDFLLESPTLSVAWLETSLSLYAESLRQSHLDLKRFLFIESQTDLLWALQQTIISQSFSIVICKGLDLPATELQRMKILTEKSQTLLFFLTDKPRPQTWPMNLQVLVDQKLKRPELMLGTKFKVGSDFELVCQVKNSKSGGLR